MTQKSRTHVFKILNTTTNMCGKKCGSSWAQVSINQKTQMYYLVSVDHNGMAAHLTRSECERFSRSVI